MGQEGEKGEKRGGLTSNLIWKPLHFIMRIICFSKRDSEGAVWFSIV